MRKQQTSLTHVRRQDSHVTKYLCSALIGCLTSQSVEGGLKCGGLIKADYKGGECAGIRLRWAQWWLHRGSIAASSSLSSSSTCSRAAACTNDRLTGKRQDISGRDDLLPRRYYNDLSWLSNLWLLTWSAQRLTMLLYCVVHQAQFHWLCHLFKAAFNYLFFGPKAGDTNPCHYLLKPSADSDTFFPVFIINPMNISLCCRQWNVNVNDLLKIIFGMYGICAEKGEKIHCCIQHCLFRSLFI